MPTPFNCGKWPYGLPWQKFFQGHPKNLGEQNEFSIPYTPHTALYCGNDSPADIPAHALTLRGESRLGQSDLVAQSDNLRANNVLWLVEWDFFRVAGAGRHRMTLTLPIRGGPIVWKPRHSLTCAVRPQQFYEVSALASHYSNGRQFFRHPNG